MKLSVGSFLIGGAILAVAPLAAQAPDQQQQQQQQVAPDRNILHVQVILDKLGFGPGVIDGRPGQSLTNALRAFQETRGLAVSGEIDRPTLAALQRFRAVRPTIQVRLDRETFAGPFVNPIPEDHAEQEKLDRMAYTRPLEKLAERFHTTPATLVALNPGVGEIRPGSVIVAPNALPRSRDYPADATDEWRRTLNGLNVEAAVPQAARITVSKSRGILRAYDANDRLIAQYTATIGSASDPLPLGNWRVNHVSPNPDWKMNPAILTGVNSNRQSRIIPPGPNNPVGVVWIDLNRQHYGIHGTNDPARIGVAQSNGCVRLTNWDAARVALMVKGGVPVIFQA